MKKEGQHGALLITQGAKKKKGKGKVTPPKKGIVSGKVNQKQKGMFIVKCYFCRKKGHVKKYCNKCRRSSLSNATSVARRDMRRKIVTSARLGLKRKVRFFLLYDMNQILLKFLLILGGLIRVLRLIWLTQCRDSLQAKN